MSAIGELFSQAQNLPPVEREQLALMLLDSLPEDGGMPIGLDPDYEAELERRLEAIKSGRLQGHDLESVMQSLRTTLQQRSAP
jgi:putative addiction module component (TIGR02574 family)